jgi:1-phosphofructokinase family hexose kinase
VFVCVTPNGDLDLTIRRLGPGQSAEVDVGLVAECAGGKGHNAARFLSGLGHQVTALGFAGGWAGVRLEALLRLSGVATDLTRIREPSRFYVSVLDEKGVRERSFRQPGPRVTDAEGAALLDSIAAHAGAADVVILGGSLPGGLGEDFYARAVAVCGRTPTVVDCSGPPLTLAVEAQPWMVKINEEEFGSFEAPIGGSLTTAIRRAADRSGVERWWITRGSAGAVALDDGESLAGAIEGVVTRNTSGAGDAFLAGLLHATDLGLPAAGRMAWGLAVAASVCEQEAPLVPDKDRVGQFLARALVEQR